MTILLVSLMLCNVNPGLERTIDALIQVESGGNWNAVGDRGRSIGGLQISRAYWSDGTRFLGVSWPYSDARDPVKARRVVRAYLERYQRAGGYPATPETYARLHNGGPNGPRWSSSLAHWQKVQAAMMK